jgi:hypothetical protein
MIFIPGFIMFITLFNIPMFIDRYLIFLTPLFFIIIAIVISKFGSKFFLIIS